jgi:hypothetical protein
MGLALSDGGALAHVTTPTLLSPFFPGNGTWRSGTVPGAGLLLAGALELRGVALSPAPVGGAFSPTSVVLSRAEDGVGALGATSPPAIFHCTAGRSTTARIGSLRKKTRCSSRREIWRISRVAPGASVSQTPVTMASVPAAGRGGVWAASGPTASSPSARASAGRHLKDHNILRRTGFIDSTYIPRHESPARPASGTLETKRR